MSLMEVSSSPMSQILLQVPEVNVPGAVQPAARFVAPCIFRVADATLETSRVHFKGGEARAL